MSPSYLLFGDTGLWFQGPFWTSNWFPYREGEAGRVIGAHFGVQKNKKKKIPQSTLGPTWEWGKLNHWLVLFSISNWKFRWGSLILEQDCKPKTCPFLLLCASEDRVTTAFSSSDLLPPMKSRAGGPTIMVPTTDPDTLFSTFGQCAS